MVGKAGARRAAWALANEAVDALSNLVLSVWIARNTDAAGFGAFGVAYAILPIGIVACRAIASTPFLIRPGSGAERQQARAGALGTSVCVGLLVSLLYVGVGLASSSTLAACAFTFAAFAPFLMLQDSYVYLFYADQRPQAALVNNLVWLFLQLGGFVALDTYGGARSPASFVALWSLAAAAAVMVSGAIAKVSPNPGRVVWWIRRNRDLVSGLTVEEAARQTAQQSVVWIIARVASLVAVGGFKVVQVALGVPRLLVQGIAPMVLSEFSRTYKSRPTHLPGQVRLVSVANVSVVAASTVVLYATPRTIGERLFGASWQTGHGMLVAYGVATGAVACSYPFQLALKAMERTSTTALARLPLALLVPVLTSVGLVVSGAAAGIWCLAGACAVDALTMALLFANASKNLRAARAAG